MKIKEFLTLVISGGQTGADMAGLISAKRNNIPTGGWIPNNGMNEDGLISDAFEQTRCKSNSLRYRTIKNVMDSDGTLIVCRKFPLTPGSQLTRDYAVRNGTPNLVISLADSVGRVALASGWIVANNIRVLNVAGSRESKSPGIHVETQSFLDELFDHEIPEEGDNSWDCG